VVLSDLVAFVPATDLDRARAFYEGVLGLAVTEHSRFAVAFDVDGTMLRVTAVEHRVAAPYTVLGWAVPDIAAAIDDLTARGVAFERFEGMEQDERGVWRSPSGARVAWFHDPDGNVLSLTQHHRVSAASEHAG
jgi:catechol 2,3-dioxygenase-like lactoylglutathione lyase family enzyme